MGFAGVAGIMAAEQDVMILGGVVMAFFLILLFIIRIAKRNEAPHQSYMSGDTESSRHSNREPRITDLTHIEDLVDNVARPQVAGSAVYASNDDPDNSRRDNQDVKSTDAKEDFKIFRRTPLATSKKHMSLSESAPVIEELELIEKNMIAIKGLFHDGHITRDVYVDETRTLYTQAKILADMSGAL